MTASNLRNEPAECENAQVDSCLQEGGFGPRWKFPLTIKAMILDLDGSMMPSYKTLEAIHELTDYLTRKHKFAPDDAEKFIDNYLREITFQSLLHEPEATRAAAKLLGIPLDHQIRRTMHIIQEESFRLYDGVHEVLALAKKAGVFVGIYTNSPDFFAVKRLCRALVDIETAGIHALWTKQHDTHESLSWLTDKSTSMERKYGPIVITYTYQKPNNSPIKEIMQLGDIRANEVLVVGEGSKDLKSVYMQPGNPLGVFCFQELGARDICPKQSGVNERMRPGGEPLGFAAVNNDIKMLNVESDIIRLPEGFSSLAKLIKAPNEANRKIHLSTPAIVPYVRDNCLTADVPEGRRIRQHMVKSDLSQAKLAGHQPHIT